MKIDDEILEKARYCLNCKNKPCSNGCPLHTNIPEFISYIVSGDLKKSYEILIENNIFSHVCSIVCPQEKQCEGSCIRGIKQLPTEIGRLERYVNEWAEENLKVRPQKIENEINKKIAIVGSGPAGLECAYLLRKEGFNVTVFEKEKTAGGILTQGIPDFRLDKKHIDIIITILKNFGIDFRFGQELGKDFHIKDLKVKYDAIFIGMGAENPSMYDIGDFYGIYEPDLFLKAYNDNQYLENLGNVVVIGGGNVAMDVSRAALRMGAKSSNILYRRDEENMPASKKELKEALDDGVNFIPTTRVIKAEGEKRKIEKLKCIKTEVIDAKAIDIPNSEFYFNADTVVFAIGLKPNIELLKKEGLAYNEQGLVIVDGNGKTNIEGVYAGGDLQNSKATVCWALASAKTAAKSIIESFEVK